MRIFFIMLALAAHSTLSAQECGNLPWEANLTYRANTESTTFLRATSTVASDALLPLAVGVPSALYLYGVLNMRIPSDATQNHWRYAAESGVQGIATMGVTYGVVVLLKNVIDRPRPYQQYPGCIENIRNDADGSMPSGHSAGAAALATTLILRYPTWGVIAPSVLYALVTGYSRLNLGMHYLSDVLVGYAIGTGVAIGINALNSLLFDLAEPLLPAEGSTAVLPLLGFRGTQSVPIISFCVPM